VRAEELRHGEAPHAVGAEHLGHGLVRLEVLPVVFVLQVVLLDVGPELV
jgi:hypothetical protein